MLVYIDRYRSMFVQSKREMLCVCVCVCVCCMTANAMTMFFQPKHAGVATVCIR